MSGVALSGEQLLVLRLIRGRHNAFAGCDCGSREEETRGDAIDACHGRGLLTRAPMALTRAGEVAVQEAMPGGGARG